MSAQKNDSKSVQLLHDSTAKTEIETEYQNISELICGSIKESQQNMIASDSQNSNESNNMR